MAPTVVLASNGCGARVRGTADVVSPHGIPVDLLNRSSCLGKSYALYREDRWVQPRVDRQSGSASHVDEPNLKLGLGVLERLAEEVRRSVRYLGFMTSRMCEAYELDSYALQPSFYSHWLGRPKRAM
ncbi:hypothetical protein JVT61DRAFT_12345 [Boletus reticuloceps]|uniref:TIP49 P-loop domain-containing protein n=1 Tax=Boletus reticuloceps TaxID=495285 RepID=A0A8I2YDY6_9AGAM|nr:hypothetical protein JVT61DRAFT_12345 [Boletus reticuloceps]